MNTQERNEYANEIIATLTENLEAMRRELSLVQNTLTTNGWCVRNTGVFMRYDFEGLKVVSVRAGGILGCTQLSKENAMHIAKQTTNGSNNVAEAVPYVRALEEEIQDQENNLNAMRIAIIERNVAESIAV